MLSLRLAICFQAEINPRKRSRFCYAGEGGETGEAKFYLVEDGMMNALMCWLFYAKISCTF